MPAYFDTTVECDACGHHVRSWAKPTPNGGWSYVNIPGWKMAERDGVPVFTCKHCVETTEQKVPEVWIEDGEEDPDEE